MPSPWSAWWRSGEGRAQRLPGAGGQGAIARGEDADSPGSGLDALERRLMLTATATVAIQDIVANKNQAAISVDLNNYFDDPALVGTVVRFDTVMGAIPVQLFDVADGGRTAAPLAVANFLHYVNGDSGYGTYDNSIVHRSDPGSLNLSLPVEQRGGFVIQGGGFAFLNDNFYYVNASPPTIANEYSPTRSNVRGTLAMAMVGGDVNSASDQWFINLSDNSATLNPQSFTVFGQVVGSGMDVVDAISALPSYDASGITSAFNQMPLRNMTSNSITSDNVILIRHVAVGKLTYTVTTDAPGLLTVATDGGTLVLNAAASQTGSGHVTVTATDVNGQSVQDTFLVTVQAGANPPVIGSLTATPNPVNRGVQSLTLTANSVTDPGGAVTKVEFFRDSNGNGNFEPGVDAKLGEDTSAGGGWTLTVPTTGWVVGPNKVFARAQDADNNGSTPVVYTVTGGNAAPTLTTVDTLVATSRSNAWDITYDTLANYSNAADANSDPIQFRIEQVTSGTLTKNSVAVTPGVTLLGPGDTLNWTVPNTTSFLYNCFTVRAWDGQAASAFPVQVQIKVDRAPGVSALAFSPSPIAMPGSTATLTATVSDPDDSVAKVEFFYDTNNNGSFDDPGDANLGSDTSATGGWTLALASTATSAFRTGAAVFFVRATDQYGVTTTAKFTNAVNAPPTVASVTTNGPLARGGNVTVTANNVADTDGTISKVEFYRDLNGNGLIDAGEPLVGTGAKQGATTHWTASVATTGWGVTPAYIAGTNYFIARATDNNGGMGTAQGSVVLTNGVPTIGSVTTNPTTLSRGSQVTITAAQVADPDGTVAKVEYYVDTNGNGVFDAGDAKIGEQATGQWGAYAYKYTVPGDAAPGPMKFFAKATDNDGGTSNPAATPSATVLPAVGVVATSPGASEEGPAAGTFRITRSGSIAAPLTVNYALGGTATNGTDYATVITSAVIAANQTSVDVTVTPVDDQIVEPAETVILTLSANAAYSVDAAAATATVTIADNDAGGLWVSPTSGLITSEAGSTAAFGVKLTAKPSANVVVPIASDDTTEGTVNLTSLTFTPQNWNVQQTITVRGVDDQVSDGDILYDVLVGPSTSTVDAYNGLTATVTLTNYDNEPVGQYVGTFNGYTMDYASFPPGVLKDTVTADIQVTITGGNGTLLDPYTGTVTEQGTLVITVVQQNPGGTLFGDTIGANSAGTISGSWGNVAGHIDGVADNGDSFTVNFTNGMFVGDQIWATVTVDLELAGVAPIVSNVQLARQH